MHVLDSHCVFQPYVPLALPISRAKKEKKKIQYTLHSKGGLRIRAVAFYLIQGMSHSSYLSYKGALRPDITSTIVFE